MKIKEQIIETEMHELGYTEQSDGWTKYGQWFADNIAHNQAFARADWCAMFQTWSMYISNVPGSCWPYVSPQGSEVNYMANWLEEKGFRTGADDMPEPGDILFYSWEGDESDLDHVGLITKVQGSTPDKALLQVCEGNYNNMVAWRWIYYRDARVAKTFRLPCADDDVFPSLSFMLKRGDEGYAVEILQAGLIYRGYDILGGVDGIFGQYTEDALKAYQENNELIVDGKAGTETFSRLMGCEL